MKRLLSITAILCFFAFTSNAQNKEFKIAYFDLDSLLSMMPEFTVASDSAQKYYDRLEKEMYNMTIELQKKTDEYISKDWSKEESVRRQKELDDLEQRIKDFQVVSQDEYTEYRSKMLVPIFHKVQAAAKKVAKEKGYAYVLDGSQSATVIIFASESYDIFDDMCKELKIPGYK
jgi:outer membrane protein